MAQYFTEGSLREYENIMRMTPHQKPFCSGIRIQCYSAEDCDCQYCAYYYGKRSGCVSDDCLFLTERLFAGALPYDELMLAMAVSLQTPELTKRVMNIIAESEESNMFFIDRYHMYRFNMLEARGIIKHTSPSKLVSALYLLTANSGIWRRAKEAVDRSGVDFSRISMSCLNYDEIDTYILYKTAKELYTGAKQVSINELCDHAVVNDVTFRIIMNSFAVRRYGTKAIQQPGGY